MLALTTRCGWRVPRPWTAPDAAQLPRLSDGRVAVLLDWLGGRCLDRAVRLWEDPRRNRAGRPHMGELDGRVAIVTGAGGGLAILTVALHAWPILPGAFSGFVLVGPIVATGLYELSRRLAAGERPTLHDASLAWARGTRPLPDYAGGAALAAVQPETPSAAAPPLARSCGPVIRTAECAISDATSHATTAIRISRPCPPSSTDPTTRDEPSSRWHGPRQETSRA